MSSSKCIAGTARANSALLIVSKGGQIDSAWTGDFSLSIHDCRTYARRSTKTGAEQVPADHRARDAAGRAAAGGFGTGLRGADTKFNQRYYPESITRSLSAEEGYQMEVQAKNPHAEREAAQ